MDSNTNIPKHIAFIMDGNRRWATENGLPKLVGHQKGAEILKKIINHCGELGVQVVTVYAFSTENWDRPSEEVNYLMALIVEWINNYLSEITSKGIQLRHIGNRERLPEKVLKCLDNAVAQTKDNNKMVFNLAFNYGGRDELKRAVNRLVSESRPITEKNITDSLDTAGLPDPDLVIRTSGEMRLSGFLLWQAAYAELYFAEKYWPDFNEIELDKAISEFNSRQRRFGK